MDILVSASFKDRIPVELYKTLDFDACGLKKEQWRPLSSIGHLEHQKKWKEIFQEFEYISDKGSYFLCLDKQGNLCLATEREIEKLEAERA